MLPHFLVILAERRAKIQKEIEDLNKKEDHLSSVIKSERYEPESNLRNGLKSEIKGSTDRSDGKHGRADERKANDRTAAGNNDREAVEKTVRGKSEECDEERLSEKSDGKHPRESTDRPHLEENSNGGENEQFAAEEHSQKQPADDSSNDHLAASNRSGDESNQTNEISQPTNDESITNQEVSRSEANAEEHMEEHMENNAETDDNSNSQQQTAEKALEDKEFEPIYDE